MTVYICSPYRAKKKQQFEKQLNYTKVRARLEVLDGNEVIVPHLYYPLFLDDNEEIERKRGMESAIKLMSVCDYILVCKRYGISSGMKEEIRVATEKGISIKEVS